MIKCFLIGCLVTCLHVSVATSQSLCDLTSFAWVHAPTEQGTLVRCSDSNHDYEWSLFVEPYHWELPAASLNKMKLPIRYETFYQLSLSRGTFTSLLDQIREELSLSDKDLLLVLVDLVRELPYDETFGGEQSPETTLALGKGDCSDKSLLLATLFGELGIQTNLVLDEVNEHAFLAFPGEEYLYYAIETTNPNGLVFEEKSLEEGQILVPLSPGEKTLDTQLDILNQVLTWQAEHSAMFGPAFVYGNCTIRQNLIRQSTLENQRDSLALSIMTIEDEVERIQGQLAPLIEEHVKKVEIYNSLTTEINDLINMINEWERSLE